MIDTGPLEILKILLPSSGETDQLGFVVAGLDGRCE